MKFAVGFSYPRSDQCEEADDAAAAVHGCDDAIAAERQRAYGAQCRVAQLEDQLMRESNMAQSNMAPCRCSECGSNPVHLWL